MPVQGLMYVAGKPAMGTGAPFTGTEAATGTPAQFTAVIVQEIDKWTRVVKTNGIQL